MSDKEHANDGSVNSQGGDFPIRNLDEQSLIDRTVQALCQQGRSCDFLIIDYLVNNSLNQQYERIDAMSNWDDDATYPVSDWQHEVLEGNTRQSYKEWLKSKYESGHNDSRFKQDEENEKAN